MSSLCPFVNNGAFDKKYWVFFQRQTNHQIVKFNSWQVETNTIFYT